MEHHGTSWNIAEHCGTWRNIMEHSRESCRTSWKLMEYHGTMRNITEHSRRILWNIMETHGTWRNIPEGHHRTRKKLMEKNGTWWKVVELSRRITIKGREHGREVVEYSRTFYSEMYILNSPTDLRDRWSPPNNRPPKGTPNNTHHNPLIPIIFPHPTNTQTYPPLILHQHPTPITVPAQPISPVPLCICGWEIFSNLLPF